MFLAVISTNLPEMTIVFQQRECINDSLTSCADPVLLSLYPRPLTLFQASVPLLPDAATSLSHLHSLWNGFYFVRQ